VGYGAAFAPVLFELDDPDNVVEPAAAGKVEDDLDGSISAAVVDDKYLIA
jgi:hypothetical protein